MWLLVLISAAAFFVSFMLNPAFPARWSILVLLIMLAIAIFCLILTLYFSRRNIFVKLINIVTALALTAGAVLLPYYTDRVERLFPVISETKIVINLYALTDSPYEKIEDCADAIFISAFDSDPENQEYAIQQLRSQLSERVYISDKKTAEDAAERLLSGHGDVLIMSQAFEGILTDTEAFEDFSERTKVIGSYERVIEIPEPSGSALLTEQPFTVFIAGNDQTGDLSYFGRTDVNMLVTVNPLTHQVLLVNYPRDSYVKNPAYNDAMDKLTHLGMSGMNNTLKGLKEISGTDVDHYILVNFSTFHNIITALHGIEIDNPYKFTAINGMKFEEGRISLNADEALMYVRERKRIPGGDFGRIQHQQIVMKAIIEKVTGPDVIVHFDGLLKAIEGQFLTSMKPDQIFALCRRQLDENASWSVISYHITGRTGTSKCASFSNSQLAVVYPDKNQLEFTAGEIQEIKSGRLIEQKEIPEAR